MRAPLMAPPSLKLMSMYFPKRLELSFRMVLAFPKAERKTEIDWVQVTVPKVLEPFVGFTFVPSKMGFASRICCSIQEC